MSEENLYQITGTVRMKKGQGRSLKIRGAWIYDNEIDAVTDGFREWRPGAGGGF